MQRELFKLSFVNNSNYCNQIRRSFTLLEIYVNDDDSLLSRITSFRLLFADVRRVFRRMLALFFLDRLRVISIVDSLQQTLQNSLQMLALTRFRRRR